MEEVRQKVGKDANGVQEEDANERMGDFVEIPSDNEA